MAADAQGNWYLADTGNNRIRKVQPGGNLFTIAGNGNAAYFGDGTPRARAPVSIIPTGWQWMARGTFTSPTHWTT